MRSNKGAWEREKGEHAGSPLHGVVRRGEPKMRSHAGAWEREKKIEAQHANKKPRFHTN